MAQRRWHLIAVAAGIQLAVSAALPAEAAIRPPGFEMAQAAYESMYSIDQRIRFQVLMIAAGYYNGVPNENFNLRLFKAIQTFQSENGIPADGVVDKLLVDRLLANASPMLDQWGFRSISHPTRRATIWVPIGLGLRGNRNEAGLAYTDPRERLRLDFTTVPGLAIGQNYVALQNALISEGARFHYKVTKGDWFAISATTSDGRDHYLRYHQDGSNVTGFTLSWNNAKGNVAGERIAVLVSASLWSNLTGAAFIDPPSVEPPQIVSKAQPIPAAPAPSPPTPASPPAPAPSVDGKVSSGSGFFVTAEGHFVTNAHVVEGCSDVRVRGDDGLTQDARIVARDGTNDLALLKLSKGPSKPASLRLGIRLGEGVAAFGYPHSDMLSTSGNFTLGNVTALTGLGDDSRFIQISAPVQSGNSGGPLLDNSGNLAGVVTAKLNALKVALRAGDLPQNVNFAVKASILSTFLDANRVSYAVVTPAPKRSILPTWLTRHER